MKSLDEIRKSLKASFKKASMNIQYLPFQYGLRIVFIIIAFCITYSIMSTDTNDSADTSWWDFVPIIGLILIIALFIWVILKISGIQSSDAPSKNPNNPGRKISLKTPLWLKNLWGKITTVFALLIGFYLVIWFLFWITGHRNPIAYITGEQTEEILAPSGNWTKWLEVEDHWKGKLFYDGKIALQLKFENGSQQIVFCEQRNNNGKTLYIKDATTGKLLSMFLSDKVTEVRMKSIEETPITVTIDYRKENFPGVQ